MNATERQIEIGPRRKRKFPWILFLLLLASIYVFWILPYYQLGSRPVKVEFSGTASPSVPAGEATPQSGTAGSPQTPQ